ncbi:MAG TPA: hypothetical protein VGH30_04700 [Jatrophihabitantaceae bacterium]|jgi:hypothetical protein
MPSIFRDPIPVTYVDADNNQLAVTDYADLLPRVGENIRLGKTPYVVERIGYDMPDKVITGVWVMCRPA